ncbi:MAG: mechanosensitive ion channel, partial [Deltaproteobacteria bacterium]|nr:mechanosensitive ion channel [Deltaproteobacteria bacterium]
SARDSGAVEAPAFNLDRGGVGGSTEAPEGGGTAVAGADADVGESASVPADPLTDDATDADAVLPLPLSDPGEVPIGLDDPWRESPPDGGGDPGGDLSDAVKNYLSFSGRIAEAARELKASVVSASGELGLLLREYQRPGVSPHVQEDILSQLRGYRAALADETASLDSEADALDARERQMHLLDAAAHASAEDEPEGWAAVQAERLEAADMARRLAEEVPAATAEAQALLERLDAYVDSYSAEMPGAWKAYYFTESRLTSFKLPEFTGEGGYFSDWLREMAAKKKFLFPQTQKDWLQSVTSFCMTALIVALMGTLLGRGAERLPTEPVNWKVATRKIVRGPWIFLNVGIALFNASRNHYGGNYLFFIFPGVLILIWALASISWRLRMAVEKQVENDRSPLARFFTPAAAGVLLLFADVPTGALSILWFAILVAFLLQLRRIARKPVLGGEGGFRMDGLRGKGAEAALGRIGNDPSGGGPDAMNASAGGYADTLEAPADTGAEALKKAGGGDAGAQKAAGGGDAGTQKATGGDDAGAQKAADGRKDVAADGRPEPKTPLLERFAYGSAVYFAIISLLIAVFGYPRVAILAFMLLFTLVNMLLLGDAFVRLGSILCDKVFTREKSPVKFAVLNSFLLPVTWSVSLLCTIPWLIAIPGSTSLLRGMLTRGYSVGEASFDLTKVLLIVGLFFMFRSLMRLGRTSIDSLPKEISLSDTQKMPMQMLLTYVIWIIFAVVAMGLLGVNWTSMAVAASGLGLGLGIGLQNIFNNMVSGIILIFGRSVRKGDFVEVEGTSGTVQRVDFRCTVVETLSGSLVYVPNSTMVSTQLTNWTQDGSEAERQKLKRTLVIRAYYDTDVKLALKLIKDACHNVKHVESDPPPQSVLSDLNEKYLEFNLSVTVNPISETVATLSRLRVKIEESFQANGFKLYRQSVEIINLKDVLKSLQNEGERVPGGQPLPS